MFQITYLTLGWEPPDTLETDLFTFTYHPAPEMISKAFATLIKKLSWDKFTILYEDDTSKYSVQLTNKSIIISPESFIQYLIIT